RALGRRSRPLSQVLAQWRTGMNGQEIILHLQGVRRDFTQPSDLIDRVGRFLRRQAPPSPVRAVAGVDLDVRHGEVLAVVGESGCGKTTLGRMLTGIIPPTAGKVYYRGR